VVAAIFKGGPERTATASSSPYISWEPCLVCRARCAVLVSEKYFLDTFLYGKSSRHAQGHTNPNSRKHEIEGLGQNQKSIFEYRIYELEKWERCKRGEGKREGGGIQLIFSALTTSLLARLRSL